ncbi:(Fe-S)-binding protein [Prochlorococcus sp. MIT 1300]|uniref:(Fe-S)-binding protein n=1 Tax=Prochlorococcus sp. MIT 1300 TaxID=3096218 RepID=UPI002A7667C4|nr:(Fe-S)-binding protein [Prochlorococcus sp. MIT 1300]
MSQKSRLGEGQTLKTVGNATDPCVHCGFCLPTCASYRVLGTEMDSPRGRIHMLKAIQNEELKLDPTIASHFDTCLGCFACVTACPSGVRYDELIEKTRPKLNKAGLRSPCDNFLRKLLLNILPYPKRLRKLLNVIRLYSGKPIQKIFQKSGFTNLLGPQIASMEALLPELKKNNFIDNFQVINPAQGDYRGRVGLVLGCVQRCFDPEVNQATLEVLQANGFEVLIPHNQGCCGAVTHHQGDLQQTKELASKLVQSFTSSIEPELAKGDKSIDAILIAASGCGHTMKAYGALFNNEIDFKVPVMDVHEFLFSKGLSHSFLASLKPLRHKGGEESSEQNPCEVVYHDACHMIHGQGISYQPRDLLKNIPYLLLKEATEAGVCCGSAGIYNIVRPEEAADLGKIKAADLSKTGAEIVASANIGCTLQLRCHLDSKLTVKHPMELLKDSQGIN